MEWNIPDVNNAYILNILTVYCGVITVCYYDCSILLLVVTVNQLLCQI